MKEIRSIEAMEHEGEVMGMELCAGCQGKLQGLGPVYACRRCGDVVCARCHARPEDRPMMCGHARVEMGLGEVEGYFDSEDREEKTMVEVKKVAAKPVEKAGEVKKRKVRGVARPGWTDARRAKYRETMRKKRLGEAGEEVGGEEEENRQDGQDFQDSREKAHGQDARATSEKADAGGGLGEEDGRRGSGGGKSSKMTRLREDASARPASGNEGTHGTHGTDGEHDKPLMAVAVPLDLELVSIETMARMLPMLNEGQLKRVRTWVWDRGGELLEAYRAQGDGWD